MTLLILYIGVAVGISFLCSVLEAVLLSCTPSYLESLKASKPKLYKSCIELTTNIERSLAAILSLNTFAHTIGAAGAGAQAQIVFGDKWMSVFAVILTLVILIASEIIPKSIGARYWRNLLRFTSSVLPFLIVISYPLVIFSQWVSRLIKGSLSVKISRDEMKAFADLGLRDGSLSKDEHRIFKSMMLMPQQNVSQIMTPASRVEGFSADLKTDDIFDQVTKTPYSRLLLFDEGLVDSYVLRDEVLLIKALDQNEDLEKIKKTILRVLPTTKIEAIFVRLINRHEHIAAVADIDNNFMGVITLEDVFEKMLDKQILDELDRKS